MLCLCVPAANLWLCGRGLSTEGAYGPYRSTCPMKPAFMSWVAAQQLLPAEVQAATGASCDMES
jgi:hypothetical protein